MRETGQELLEVAYTSKVPAGIRTYPQVFRFPDAFENDVKLSPGARETLKLDHCKKVVKDLTHNLRLIQGVTQRPFPILDYNKDPNHLHLRNVCCEECTIDTNTMFLEQKS